jgi:hypothetical protein
MKKINLKKIKNEVASIRKPIRGLGYQMYVIINSGANYSVKEMAEIMNLPQRRIRALTSDLWKKGYLISPIGGSYQEGGKLRVITNKSSWFMEALKRRKDAFLLPHLKGIVNGINYGMNELPDTRNFVPQFLNETSNIYLDQVKNIKM